MTKRGLKFDYTVFDDLGLNNGNAKCNQLHDHDIRGSLWQNGKKVAWADHEITVENIT